MSQDHNCADCGGAVEHSWHYVGDKHFCDRCYDHRYPAFEEASRRAPGSYFLLSPASSPDGFNVAGPDCAGLSFQRAVERAGEYRKLGYHGPLLIAGGDAQWHVPEPGWEAHVRAAWQTNDRFEQFLDYDGKDQRQEPWAGLRYSRICRSIDPWNVIACPCCGSRQFVSVDGAAVYCTVCDTEFKTRYTAGDPGLVVDAYDRNASRPRQKRRLWTGYAYCILKTGENEPHWIVGGQDPRLAHDFVPGRSLRADEIFTYLDFEIGPEWRPIFRSSYPWNSISYSNHRFICGDCAERLGVNAYHQWDTDVAPERDNRHAPMPKIGGNPVCVGCGYSQPGFTLHGTELPYEPFDQRERKEES